MALPTLEKEWQFDVNNRVPISSNGRDCCRNTLYVIKEALLRGVAPWVVVGSSDSVTGGLDGIDRFTEPSAWIASVNDTGARSWIVLRQEAIGLEFLIEARASGTPHERFLRAFISRVGFTGGSNNTRPVAVDESALIESTSGGTSWIVSSADPFRSVVHVLRSTDGIQTHVIACANGNPTLWWSFQKAVDPVAGWSDPLAALCHYTSSPTYTIGAYALGAYTDSSLYGLRCTTGDRWFRATAAVPFASDKQTLNTAELAAPGAFDNSYFMLPIPLVSFDTANQSQGFLGRLADQWFGHSVHLDGRTFPEDGSRQFVQFGTLILPWDGSIPVLE